jgi:trehalose/maltose hydrolase-like predicted phosphorylase
LRHRALTHGFTGYRFRIGRLYFDPILTPQFTNYTIKGFNYHRSRFDIHMTSEALSIKHTDGDETIKVEIGSQNPKAGN